MGLSELIFFTCFLIFILAMLILDLGVFSKKSHVVSFKEAAVWSGIWVSIALAFYILLRYWGHLIHGISTFEELQAVQERYAPFVNLVPESFELSLARYRSSLSMEFITGYVLEYALSVDNIFVIILIFRSFGVRERYYKKVLFWGILGAILMRLTFIFVGSALIQRFEWILYVFGAFLIYTGIKMFLEKEDDDASDLRMRNHPMVRFASRHFAVYPRYVADYFFVRHEGKLKLTPLFLVLLIIEVTDLVFAVDSVPAVFSVTKDPYIVFFSNIFAIVGLRSMFFFLTNIMHLFHYLKVGLSVLLVYIGVKMLAHHWLVEMGFRVSYSLYIILAILSLSVIASLLFPKKDKTPNIPV
jgi:tellurite resistance protein TerC